MLLRGYSAVHTVRSQKDLRSWSHAFVCAAVALNVTSIYILHWNWRTPQLLTQPKCKSTGRVNILYVSSPTNTRKMLCFHTHAWEYRKSWDAPESPQSKPMAQRLARSCFFSTTLFSSHQKLSIGWQVVSKQFQLSSLSTVLVKGSLSHSSPRSFSLLCDIDSTLKSWQLQKGRQKI